MYKLADPIFLGTIDGINLWFTPYSDIDTYHDLEKDEQEKIDSGEWVLFTAKIDTTVEGSVLSEVWLGGCMYNDYDEFLEDGGDITDLKREAVDDAKKQLSKILGKVSL